MTQTSIVISGLGITNTLLFNIMERIREIGMMRAVGITHRQVVGMIVLEGFGHWDRSQPGWLYLWNSADLYHFKVT
ncbi:FtsX-like permease family protein [Paenibacillus rigui]|uniref:FtsX-like permease family protein n=1 Tax=Paenibacillus rigui TaxID=554312 RepID=UPI0015C5C711|nr:ABC transporter permease [Paenibacillus rigui]